jgi:H+/Cl- antiporter ClcA
MHSAAFGFVSLIIWLVVGFATVYLARSKGRHWWEGALLGFILGLIGLIIEAILPRRSGAH